MTRAFDYEHPNDIVILPKPSFSSTFSLEPEPIEDEREADIDREIWRSCDEIMTLTEARCGTLGISIRRMVKLMIRTWAARWFLRVFCRE